MKMNRRVLVATVCLSVGCLPAAPPEESVEALGGALTQVTSFGSNPAGLRMWTYVPQGVPANAPLVLALHACSQQAADYAKVGWNALADQYKFYVVYPEQTTANNALTCFNWAGNNSNALTGENDPANLTRGQGENLSIKQMVDQMKADHSIDASRVFITGLSGGAAMTAVMLATWPDVFAAGAPFAGVPYDCTTNKNQVYSPCLTPGRNLTAMQWGDLARKGDPGFAAAMMPRVQIWQGSKDSVVNPDNTVELLKQWTDAHGISQTPSAMDLLAGNPHAIYRDAAGVSVVETVQVTGMDHGTPIDPKNGCGTAAPYILDVGVCSSFYAAQFFGIIGTNTTPGADGGPATTGQDGGKDPQDGDGGTCCPSGSGTDGGGKPATKPSASCNGVGCSASGGARGQWWLALLALLLIARRRYAAL